MEENYKRIVKNTVYLYIRQFIIMALGFVSTRIVLEKLGSSDYGLNNLVGGFVGMFSVLNGILNTGTSRFLALAIGKGDMACMKRTFSTARTIHLIVGLIVVAALETFGLWFVNARLNIEEGRLFAANVIFQLAVLSTFIGITQTPYSATVTAHERFDIYAYMSLYDVIAKILVLFLLVWIPMDKLIVYGVLTFIVTLVGRIIYNWYCCRQYEECGFSLFVDKVLCKEMISFSGWTVFGNLISTVNGQGISILLNLFYNTVLNAARGLSNTVLFLITQFITGFMMAAQPQLVKYYGEGDTNRFNSLIFNVSRYSLFLVALVCVPVVMEIDYVLHLWLGDSVPEYTSTFIRITMICNLAYKGNQMVENGLIAIGRNKELNTRSTPLYLLTIPLFYSALKVGLNPGLSYWFATIPPCLTFVVNIYLLSKYTNFDGWNYFTQVFLKISWLVAVSCVVPLMVRVMMPEGFGRFVLVCSLSVVVTSLMLYYFGMNKEARAMVQEKLVSKVVDKICFWKR